MSHTSHGPGPWTPRFALPRLHVVTDDSMLRRGGWEARAVEVLEAGGPDLCLQLRGPSTDGATLHALAAGLTPHAHRTGALLSVNDRLDVALAVGAEGAHLGERSLPVGVARRLLGDQTCLGKSCHDVTEVLSAQREGADYAFLGTIFPTPTHPGTVGMGLEGLVASVTGSGTFPVVGIGGVDPERVDDVLAAGAFGVAVVRGVWSARDPARAVLRYMEAIPKRGSQL